MNIGSFTALYIAGIATYIWYFATQFEATISQSHANIHQHCGLDVD